MEKDRFTPIRDDLRGKGFCGECVEDFRTCKDDGKDRVLLEISKKGVIYAKDVEKGNISSCVIFKAHKEKMI